MKIYFRSILIILFAFSNILYSQFGFNQQEILKFASFKSFDKIQAGGEVKLGFRASIIDGWHINSNKPNEDFLIPTEIILKSDESFKFGEIIFPKSKNIELEFSDIPVSVYEGEIYFGTKVQIPDTTILGQKSVYVEFTYQGCNDVTCMAPNTRFSPNLI